MLVQVGFGILVITFLLTLYAAGAAVYGYFSKAERWVESSRRAMQLIFPLVSFSTLILVYLLVSAHYEVAYVYSVIDNSMPFYLKITALWGGQAGSLLFWSWVMSAFATAVASRKWEHDREFLPWVMVVTGVTLAFFLLLSIFFENPFARWWQTFSGEFVSRMFAPAGAVLVAPTNGNGLNELLRHPGMIFHPPMLYLGFVSFVIPYAFAIAALVTGRSDDRWIQITRRWTLAAWLFLSIGLVLGMWWAYEVLGWGGYWSWDPVEVAALAPWLVGTAFLHSVIIQEKRGMLKQWNMILIIFTYAAVIYGTFLVRSGLVSSVHAFTESSIGPVFLVFVGLTFIASTALLIYRWPDLRAENEMKSFFSRESLFLYNNLLFLLAFFVCELGIHYPLLFELFTKDKTTVGAPWYKAIFGPLFGALLLLMGIAPLSAWGYSTVRTLGRAVWKPSIPALLVPVALSALGIHNWIALLGFTLIAFVAFITLYEYGRSVLARQRTQQESFFTALSQLTARNRRRYGGYITHMAMVIMAIGILGIEVFQTTTQKSLAVGEEMQLAGYTLRYDSLVKIPSPDGQTVTSAVLSVSQGGQALGELVPHIILYPSGQPMTVPAIRSTLADDLYVVLVNWEDVSTQQAPFKVYHNPLINWLWIGSGVFVLGILVSAWPVKEKADRV